jgi:hypothetical protein
MQLKTVSFNSLSDSGKKSFTFISTDILDKKKLRFTFEKSKFSPCSTRGDVFPLQPEI